MGGGGTKTSSSNTSQQTENTNQPLDWMMPYVQAGLARSNALASKPYSPYPYVSNPDNSYMNIITGEHLPAGTDITQKPFTSALAPLNEQQTTSIGNISNWANNPSPVLDTATKQLTDTMGGSYLDPNSNPYLAKYVQQAQGDVTRNYNNSVVPQLSAAATRAGAFGGSMDTLMRSEGQRNLGDVLSKTATDIYNPAYEAERTRQLQSQLFAPTLDQASLPHYQAGLAAGDIQRQSQQDYLNELVSRYQQQNQWPYQAAQAGASIYSPYASNWGQQQGSMTGTTTQQQTTPGASPFSQIMGGALMGLGTLGSLGTGGGSTIGGGLLSNLFGLGGGASSLISSAAAAPMMMSDIRSKENMKPLGIIKELNPISFDYKPEFGEPGQIGFIADEIEKIAPGMVEMGADGFKRINVMGLITLLIAAVQGQQKQINALSA
jgi:hypothetical protein